MDAKQLVEKLTTKLEAETGQKIFTLRVSDSTDEALETIVVLEDKSILHGHITIKQNGDDFEIRIQANYI